MPPTPLPDDDRLRRAREWFERLRAEGGADLPAFVPHIIADDALTEAQRSAVSRAISTPDVCLIDTDAATGKLLAAAIARHAAQRGERVLLIAPEHDLTGFSTEHLQAATHATNSINARLAALTPLVEARRAGRLWSALYWRALFQPGLLREYERLTAEAAQQPIPGPAGISVFTPEALVGDPRTWDRMVVYGTCLIERPLLCGLSARADRWVYIGTDMASDVEAGSPVAATWRALAGEAWVREDGRLCCRVRQLTQSQRLHLSSEPLTDAPEIELRFYQPDDDAGPELAEVVFPPNMTLIAAKEFLVRELNEWPIDLDFAGIQWQESNDRLTACCGCPGRREPVPVEMNPGVRELVVDRPGNSIPWSTCGIAFDRAAGWDRPKAEAWLQTRCAGKTRRAVRV
jgi:hypothetical protein